MPEAKFALGDIVITRHAQDELQPLSQRGGRNAHPVVVEERLGDKIPCGIRFAVASFAQVLSYEAP